MSAPLNGWPDLPVESGQRVSRNVVNTQAGDGASFSVRSGRAFRVVTHTIAGRNGEVESVRELESGDADRRYVRDAENMCDHTETTPGAEEAHW